MPFSAINRRRLKSWLTWIAPIFLFPLVTWASLKFKLLPGVSAIYFPTTMGIVLVHWWGPRVLIPMFLNAVICAPLWDLSFNYAPLYALPETLTVALSWLLVRPMKADCAMPNRRDMLTMMSLGVLIPELVCNVYLYLQLIWLGDITADHFWLALGEDLLSDMLCFMMLGVPLFVFSTGRLRHIGLALRAPILSIPSETTTPAIEPLPSSVRDRVLMLSAMAALTVVTLLFPIERFWFLYAVPVMAVALIAGHPLAVLAMTWTMLLVVILPAFSHGPFGASWMMDADQIQVYLNLVVLAFATLLTGRTISDLRFESAQRQNAAVTLQQKEELLTSMVERERELNERFDLAVDAAGIGVWDLRIPGNELIWDERMYRLFGVTASAEGGAFGAWTRGVHRDDISRAEAEVHEAIVGHTPVDSEFRVVWPGGETKHLKAFARVILNEKNEPVRVIGVLADVTRHHRAEQALRKSEMELRSMMRAAPIGICRVLDRKVVWVNDVMSEIFGYTEEEMVGNPTRLFYESDDEYDRVAALMKLHAGHPEANSIEIRCMKKGGSPITIILRTAQFDPANPGAGYVATVTNISDLKRAEKEMARLQEQLRQAAKMEAVGRLAGGVAHDFNNILTVISGNAELAKMRMNSPEHLSRCLDEIGNASDRAAALTQQLLAFSRRQIIQPKVLNLNTLVRNVESMLSRLIGEDIELRTRLADDLGAVKLDPGQFEQVLLNIAINSRDAMPKGGRLTIETSNVELDAKYCAIHPDIRAGKHVMIAVSDTGHGMTDEVKEHIFEPFFTTKDVGKGTGLGLAMVFGTVKQANGTIQVFSEVGCGTTIRIYLPTSESAPSRQSNRLRPEPMLKGGHETVLLVEDDPGVRKVALSTLQQLGYVVLPAASGDEALALASTYAGHIDLLITDVVMPGMNGRELSERILKMLPDIIVLFTSGYTKDVIGHHGVIENLNFIAKPYSPTELAQKIREVLRVQSVTDTAIIRQLKKH